MVRGGSSGGGQSSLGYLFGSDAGPAKPAARAPALEPQQPPAEQRAAGFARNNVAEEKSAPAAAPVSKVDEGTSLDMGANKMGRNSNNYHRADGQNNGNFITVSLQICALSCLFSLLLLVFRV
uniref:Protein SPIRAL1-like 1 n=1 Tax=Physcomitrium patens TaxID=3218 RepID=A0A7I3YVX8_PHYPA